MNSIRGHRLKQSGLAIAIFTACVVAVVGGPQTPTQPKPEPIVLTANDLSLIVEGLELSDGARAKLATSAEERKAFAKDLRQTFALAEESKAAGYPTRPELKLQLELSRSFVVAQAYFQDRKKVDGSSPGQLVSAAEIDAFLSEPAVNTHLEAFLEVYRKNAPTNGPVTDAKRMEIRKNYAQVMIAQRKGVAAGLDRQPKIQLAIIVQQAQLLANAYIKDREFGAAESEIDAYFVFHPELDARLHQAKAEEVLKRARAGESFNALARQFSTENSSKESGGDIGWFGRGDMVKPFEDAAFALKPGEISPVLVTQFGFHIIKLEKRRTLHDSQGKSTEQVRVRHILIGFGSEPVARDRARAAIENEKRNKWIDEIVNRSRVVVPESFTIASQTGRQ